MKRLLLSIICIFVLFALTSCSASIMVDESGKTSLGLKKDKKHFYSEYNPTIIITDISEEDQQKILTAFDIIIPEQESSAHIISFIKEDCTDKF